MLWPHGPAQYRSSWLPAITAQRTRAIDVSIPEELKDKFEFGPALGAGGMGLVYRAVQLSLQRAVAIKLLDPIFLDDPDVRGRFLIEARLASRLSHPNVVQVLDFGETESEHLWIAYELVEGENIRQLINRVKLDAGQVAWLACQMLEGLGAIHKEGILHRDLKPENFLAHPNGVVKITDFGVAKEVADRTNRTRVGTVVGTPAYISPEQADGAKASVYSDIYSLAICVYEMLTGKPPFVVDTINEILDGHLFKDPPPLVLRRGGLPAGLDKTLFKALDKDPEFRYASAADFKTALEPFQAQDPRIPPPPGMEDHASAKVQRLRRRSVQGDAPQAELSQDSPRPRTSPAPKRAGGRLGQPPRQKGLPSASPGGAMSPHGPVVPAVAQGVILGSLVLGLLTLSFMVHRAFTTKHPPAVVVSATPSPPTSEPTPRPSNAPSVDPLEAKYKEMAQRAHEAISEGHSAFAKGHVTEAREAYSRSLAIGTAIPYGSGGREIILWTLEGGIHVGGPWDQDPLTEYLKEATKTFGSDPTCWLLWGLYSHSFIEPGPVQRRSVARALAQLGELSDKKLEIVTRARLQRLLATSLPMTAIGETKESQLETPRSRGLLALCLLRWVIDIARADGDEKAFEQASLSLVELAAHLARRTDGFLAVETLARVQEFASKLSGRPRSQVERAVSQVTPLAEPIRSRLAPDLSLPAPTVQADDAGRDLLARSRRAVEAIRKRIQKGKSEGSAKPLENIWDELSPMFDPTAGPIPFGYVADFASLTSTVVELVDVARLLLGKGATGMSAATLIGKIEATLTGLHSEADNVSAYWLLRSQTSIPGSRFLQAEEWGLQAIELASRLSLPDRDERAALTGYLGRVYGEWAKDSRASKQGQHDQGWPKYLDDITLIVNRIVLDLIDPKTSRPQLAILRLRSRLERARVFSLQQIALRIEQERKAFEAERKGLGVTLEEAGKLQVEMEAEARFQEAGG